MFTISDEDFSLEIFSRMSGEIYIAGLNDPSLALPDLSTESKVDENSVQILQKTAQRFLGAQGEDLEVLRSGLCFLPISNRGTPILGRIPDKSLGGPTTRDGAEGGVWLAAGHGPWGIILSLGSGKVMAEMMQGLPTSASTKSLGL